MPTDDVGRASETWIEAFAQDPQMLYLRDEQRQTRFWQWVDKVSMSTYLAIALPSTVALTVKHGEAFIIAAPARSISGPTKPLDRFLGFIQRGCAAVLKRSVGTGEQRKRNRELDAKIHEALNRLFGDRLEEMLTVNILATHPAVRRQGHGGALLDAVNSLVDFTGQTAWLQCSNTKNIPFYNQHGYETVGEVLLGDQNPTWHNHPVTVSIMVREPKGRRGVEEC
ncbi:hypothetical protein BJ165DRAFT_1521308 [Panaeolus papilionaceus]|nr:hypothetical protein BJ165DRAFT_1521308 [Panaeolus papilionaceus]